MTYIKILSCLWILGILGVLKILVPNLAQAETLTFEDCLQEVIQNNADLKTARENLRASQYESKAAWSPFLPQISGDLDWSRQNTERETSSETNTQNSYSASLNLRQNLFSGFQDQAQRDQALERVKFEEAVLDQTRAQVSYDLKSAFSNLSYSQKLEKLSQEIVERRKDNFELVDLRFQGGRENKGSYYLSKALVSQALLEKLQAKNSIDSNQQQLAKMLGRKEFKNVQLEGTLPSSNLTEFPNMEATVLETPEHRQAVAQEKISEASLILSRSAFYPNLDLLGSYGKSGTDWFPNQTRWSIGLSLSIPLFAGGKDYFSSKASSASLVAVFSNRESIDQQIRTKLKQTFNAWMEAKEKFKVDQEFLQASLIRAEIARTKYHNGLLSFEDWDIIENDLISRQKAALQSQRDQMIAESAWEKAQGKGVLP